MNSENRHLIAFYGDDFTGSTDALEFLSRAGLKTVLFIEPPRPEQLNRYQNLQAFGVAGLTRAMGPAEMEDVLRKAFQALRNLNPRHVHYKVCSTFDSSPEIGSIGKAIDTGAAIFKQAFVPLLVAAPVLGRYCLFGNLFARMGIGSEGGIYRLDRHPSMSKHPTTPADESDLRIHLRKQTTKKVGLLDILQLEAGVAEAMQNLECQVNEGCEVVLFDALNQDQLPEIGAIIDSYSSDEGSLFSVGSSGIEMALGGHWKKHQNLDSQSWPLASYSGPLLVASGSCSPVTSAQIEYALLNGFSGIAIDTAYFASNGLDKDKIESYATEAAELLSGGKDVLIHTSRGNSDERTFISNKIFSERGIDSKKTAELYGTALGLILRRTAEKINQRRMVIAGGDTSSYAARAMGIEAVEMIAPLSPGSPLCLAHAPGSAIDQVEVNFKGGQVGREDYFLLAKAGRSVETNKNNQYEI